MEGWSAAMITVRFRLDVSSACSIGPGKIALLQGIQESGVVAARRRISWG